MFIYLLLIYILGPQNEVRAQFKKFLVPKNELQRLENLKYYLCGLSPGHISEKGPWRGIGWFCVDKGSCSGPENKYQIAEGTKPDVACDKLRYNEGRDTCCFTGNLKPPVRFDDPQDPDWEVYFYVKNISKTGDLAEVEEHKRGLFHEFLQGEDSALQVAMRNYEICSVVPNGIHKGMTTWIPYVCVTKNQCEGTTHNNVNEPITFPFGDRFCSRSLKNQNRPVCCHVSTAVTLDKKQDSWKFVEFLSTQKYAPGFRSKFMCEQYNKLVCDGRLDRCAQRMMWRERYAHAGEFPHHALIGISLPRRQTFHCQGAIISKLFVLTSYDCREHDKTLANAVLAGSFKFDPDDVKVVREQIVYVQNHISYHEKHWFLLLKLWRPLVLSPFLKPACIDWFSYNKDLSSKKFDFGTGWSVGYGPIHPEANFTTYVTRYNFDLDSTKILKLEENERLCKARMPELKQKYFTGKFQDSHSHICVLGDSVYSPLLDQPKFNRSKALKNHLGYFSQGASFSVFERYCQWKVFGVYIQNDKFLNQPPLLFETIPHALVWIEEIIWRDEFDWLFFNLSWPDCADWENSKATPKRKGGKPSEAEHQFNFRSEDYYYINHEYNKFFQSESNNI